jgi:hypothetical protein
VLDPIPAGTTTAVSGTLHSLPGTNFRVEFFTLGGGATQTFLGSVAVMTDAAGVATFSTMFNKSLGGQSVVATATNLATFDTSEFSAAVPVPVIPPPAGPPPAVAVSDVTPMVRIIRERSRRDPRTGRLRIRLRLRSLAAGPLTGPFFVVLDGLPRRARLFRPDGLTAARAPRGSPYRMAYTGEGTLRPGEEVVLVLEFRNPAGRRLGFVPRVLAGSGPV